MTWEHVALSGLSLREPLPQGLRSIHPDSHGNARQSRDGWMETQCRACGEWSPDWTNRMGYTLSGKAICPECVGRSVPVASEPNKPIGVDVPALYRAARLADFPAQMRRDLEAWPTRAKFLVLLGEPDRGKTHACYAMVLAAANKGFHVRYESLDAVRRTWSANDPSQRERQGDALIGCARLILDEASGAGATPGWVEFLHGVMDERLDKQRPTVLAIAEAVENIGARFGESFASRLGMFAWIDMNKQRHRRRGIGERAEAELRKPVVNHPVLGEKQKLNDFLAGQGMIRNPDGTYRKADA